MIIATVTALILIFGGGGVQTYQADLMNALQQAPAVIEDAARLESATDVLDQSLARLEAFEKELRYLRTEFITRDSDYETSPEELAEALDRIDQAWKLVQADLIDLRFELKEHVTEAEWGKLFPPIKDK